ncbi:MAG: hypothetical protein JWR10_1279 [Rubritepida sp.]|nr:hypothetical protein [Rubritepida sp.]
MKEMALRCRCGHAGHRVDPDSQPWACLSGYGCAHAVNWLAPRDAADTSAAEVGPLWDTPRVGETHVLAVRDPFMAEVGQAFWCLYEPYLLEASTGEESAGRIEDMTLLQCEPTMLQATDARAGYCQVKVLSALTLCSLRLASLTAAPSADAIISELIYKPQILQQGNYVYIASNFESDIGAFAVFHNDPENTELLLFGRWGFHDDFFWAGRVDFSHRRSLFEGGGGS